MNRKTPPTMSEVASLAGVTKTTVSMVFRNKPGISKATRDNVFEISRGLNYRPSTAKQTRGRVHHGQIGFVAIDEKLPRFGGTAGGSYLERMLDACLSGAEERDCGVSLSRLTCQQVCDGKLPAAFRRQHLDGAVVRGNILPEVHAWLKDLGIPFALIDCSQYVPNCLQVQINNTHAMKQLTDHLIEQGAREFATITGDMNHINGYERLAGLQAAMACRDMFLASQNIAIESGFDEDAGRRGVKTLLERGCKFDALVCANDLVALGAIESLLGAGKRVPEDVRVTGFDNMDIAERTVVPLTSIDVGLEHMGRLGTQTLIEMIADGKEKDLHIKTPTQLIVRDSA